MAVPELQSEALKWQRRINMIQGAGLNPAPIQELARTDLTRLVQGGAPLGETEITSMVYGAYTGKSATAPSITGQNGSDNNPFHWIGNAVKDITTDVRSFPEGIVHEVADIFNPHKWSQIPTDLANVASDFPNISKAAKDFGLTPIIGPLVPGTFALSAGWSGFTKHPLNFLLDILPYADNVGKLATMGVDVAVEDAAHSAMSSLKAGHPFQALMRATGAEAQLTQMLLKSGGGLAEMALMPVWGKYNALARVYSNWLVKNAMDELVSAGILHKHMSLDERVAITQRALNFDPRYMKRAATLNPANISLEKPATMGEHVGEDIRVWTNPDQSLVAAGGAVDSTAPVYFSEQDARQAMLNEFPPGTPQEVIDNVAPPVAGRAPYDAFTAPADASKPWTADRIIPWADSKGDEIHYTPQEAVVNDAGELTGGSLYAVKQYSERYTNVQKIADEAKRSRAGREPDSLILTDKNGRGGIYKRDDPPYKASQKVAENAKKVNDAKHAAADVHKQVQQQQSIVRKYATEHYRRFGESDTQAAGRAASLPTVAALKMAAIDWIVQGIGLDPPIRGAFYRLKEAFDSGNITNVRHALENLRRRVKDDPTQLDYVKYLQEQSKGLGGLDVQAHAAQAKLGRLLAKQQQIGVDLGEIQKAHMSSIKELQDAFDQNPPSAGFHMIEQQVRARVRQQLTKDFIARASELQATGIAAALADMQKVFLEQLKIVQEGSKEQLMSLLNPEDAAKAFAAIETDAMRDWTQMVKAGYSPIWVHKINTDWKNRAVFGSIRPFSTGYLSEAEAKRVLDYEPMEMDIAAILPATAFEFLRAESSKQFVDWMIGSSGAAKTEEALAADLRRRHKKWDESRIATEIKDNYVDFKPKDFAEGYDPAAKYKMPKALKEGLDRLHRGSRVPFKKIEDPLMRVFKISVLSGPRHFVHVAFGGMVMQTLDSPMATLETLSHPLELWKAVRSTNPEDWPERIRNLADPQWMREQILQGNYEDTVGGLFQVQGGKRFSEMLYDSFAEGSFSSADIIHQGERFLASLNNIENTITDMYRLATFLHDIKHYPTAEAALQHVHKVFIDVDNMTPFEQLTIRNIFPFWTFTKHILRYVLSFPADHPIRASILSKLAQGVEANGKGWTDPLRLQRLFFLGAPDHHGNVLTADMSNLNPFRSMSSIFTMTGFLSGLNPGIQTGLRMIGINPLSGTPSLHTNFSYDAYVGKRVATRPKLNPFDYVSAFVPEVDIADHFLLFTDTMRELKKTNPEGYARSFWQAMNIPFAIAPINVFDIRAKAAQGQFLDAQQAVADAMRTGDTSRIRTFDAVPFEGQLYDANQVANYIDHFDQLFPGLAPRATIKKPRQVRRRQVL